MDEICKGCVYAVKGKCFQNHENSTAVVMFGTCGLKRTVIKTYIASYQDGSERCWDLVIESYSYKAGLKEARKLQKQYGKLWSFRINQK